MITEAELERLENLPKRIGHGKNAAILDFRSWGYKYHKLNGVSVYKLTKRIIASGIGRPYDEVFSYFCKQVPKHFQHVFEDEFTIDSAKRRWRLYDKYYGYWVDENRLIQETVYPKTKKVYIFKSENYRTEKVYVSDDKYESKVYYPEIRVRALKGDSIYTKVISGYTQEYPWNSATAKQLRAEEISKKRKHFRDLNVLNNERNKADFILRYQKRITKEKEREEDRIRMEALGFDSTSFKGIEYHGQKRKLKNGRKN